MNLSLSAIQLQTSKVAQTALALVASVILARAIGPTGLGLYAALIAFAVLLQGLTSFGFEDLVLARGPLYGSETAKAHSLYRRVLRIRGSVIAALGAVAVAALVGDVPDPFSGTTQVAFGCALLYSAFNSLATLGATVQAARVRPANSAALDACWSFGVTATYGVLLLIDRLTLQSALLTIVAWQAAVDIGYARFLVPIAAQRETGLGINPFRARETAMFWTNGLLSIGVGKNSDVLAMNVAGAPAAAVGRYSAAYNANLTAAQWLVQGTGTMLYVGLGRVFADGSSQRIADAWRTTTIVSALLSSPILVYCVIFPHGVLTAVYGKRYAVGASALVVLAATGVLARGLGGGSNQSLLFLAHRQNQVLIARGLCVTLNIALDIVMYHLIGIVGVALASGGSGLAITGLELLLSRRIVPLQVPWAPMARIVLPYAVTGFAVRLLLGDGGGWLPVITSICVVFTAGTLLLTVTRPLRLAEVPDSAPAAVKRLLGHIAAPRPVPSGP